MELQVTYSLPLYASETSDSANSNNVSLYIAIRGMRDYITACGFPLRKIGDTPVPRLILGHLPFIGESYQGPETNREYRARFSDIRNTVRILRVAVEKYGLTVAAAGIMPDNKLTNTFFKAIKETERLTNTRMATIPCIQIPLTIHGKPVDTYRRWLTYYKLESRVVGERILSKYLEDPVLQCRPGWKAKFKEALQNSRPYAREELKYLEIDDDRLENGISNLKDFHVLFAELGSETDFLAMTGKLDLIADLVDQLRNRNGYRVLLGVHHAGLTVPKLENSGIDFDGYVTPVNKLGVMMFPTKDMALRAVKTSRKPVIAIKPLAGGRIEPKQALEHVYKEAGMSFCMIGVGSVSEAEEDFKTARKILKG